MNSNILQFTLLLLFLTIAKSQYNMSHYTMINVSASDNISSFAISDDNQYIIAAGNSKTMYFLKNNGNGWSLTQNFTNTMTGNIQYVDISSYHEWAVFQSYDGNIYVFKFYSSNSSFDLHQVLSPKPAWMILDVDLTDDYQNIICSSSFGQVFLYEFNGTDFVISEVLDLSAKNVRMCDDKSFFVYSQAQKLAVHTRNGSTYSYSYDIISTYTRNQLFSIDLSADCNYLVAYSAGDSTIYQNNGTHFNSLSVVSGFFGKPSISDYGQIVASIVFFTDTIIYEKLDNLTGYSQLGTIQNTSRTNYCTIGGNYALGIVPGGITVYKITGMGVKIEEQELPNNTNNIYNVEKDEISEDDNLWLIIGCVVGGVVIMAVITGLVFYFKKSPSNVVLDKFDTEANEGEDKKEQNVRETIIVQEIAEVKHELSDIPMQNN